MPPIESRPITATALFQQPSFECDPFIIEVPASSGK